MDWTTEKSTQAEGTLQGWYALLHQHGFGPGLVATLRQAGVWQPDTEFLGALANDLNTAGAIARLHALAGKTTAATLAPFAVGLEMLGLVPDWAVLADLAKLGIEQVGQEPWLEAVVTRLLLQRQDARANRDFAEADRIRAVLTHAGVLVTDVGGIASWQPGPDFDAAKLEALR
jgi:cysteinyl-tRNA synthetase